VCVCVCVCVCVKHCNFYIRTLHLVTIKVYYSPTNAQVNVFKKQY